MDSTLILFSSEGHVHLFGQKFAHVITGAKIREAFGVPKRPAV